MKQSAPSRSVQLVEHSFGVAIFERSSGGVRTTPAGALNTRSMEALVTATRTNGRDETGHPVIGFCTSLTAGNLGATFLDLKKAVSASRT